MVKAKITIGSHYIRFEEMSHSVREILRLFMQRRLVGVELKKVNGMWIRERGKVFACADKAKTYIIYHVRLKDELLDLLRSSGIRDEELDITVLDYSDYDVAPTRLKVKAEFKPYDYQVKIIDETLSEGARKIINLPMGMGKTLTALKVIEKLGTRPVIAVLPKYKEKWIEDVVTRCDGMGSLDPKDKSNRYLVIDKKQKLIDYLDMMLADPKHDEDDIDCIIITITVLADYIKLYNELPVEERFIMVPPWDIWKVMRVGFKLVDESHEHFHRNFIIDLNTHIPKTCYLSATLEPTDSFMVKMYELMYPKFDQMGGDVYTPFIDVIAYQYRHDYVQNYRYQSMGRYHHGVYETSLLRNNPKMKKSLQRYLDLINRILIKHYIEVKKPDQKAILFFSTVKMCDVVKDYLAKQYTDLNIVRYTSEDEYESLATADIIVSTPGSAGTGLDIYGLILGLMAITVDSKQQNLQIMGRTRELKQWPGQHPVFAYLVMDDIQASVRYHERKLGYMKPKARTYQVIDTMTSI